MTRFSVEGYPSLAPGYCLACKSAANGPFVDTGASDQWIGTYYICTACLTEMAAVLAVAQFSPEARLINEVWVAGYTKGVKDVENGINRVLTDHNSGIVPGLPKRFAVEEPKRDAEVSPSLFDVVGNDDAGAKQSDSTPGLEGPVGLSGDSGNGDGTGADLPELVVVD